MIIELDQARDLLRQAVETQGRDFVYNPGRHGECRYEPVDAQAAGISPDAPQARTGCLIGVALTLAGISILAQHMNTSIAFAETTGQATGAEALSSGTRTYFYVAQEVQDNGGSWGEAYDEAEQWWAERQ